MSTIAVEERQRLKRVMPKYLRPADIVEMTGLAKSTVMDALWSGRLTGHRLGRAWLIPVEAVDEWIRGDDRAA